MLRCRDLKNLYSLSKMNFIAGNKGLSNVIRWPYVTETLTFSHWVHGDELLIVSGISQQKGYNLLSIIKEAVSSKMAGALILIGDNYETNITDEVIEFADKSSFPLMTITWKIPLVDILEDICRTITKNSTSDINKENIISSIIFSDSIDTEDLISKCRLINYNISSPQQMTIIQLYTDSKSDNCSDSPYKMDLIIHVCNFVKDIFSKNKINALISVCANNIIIMYETDNMDSINKTLNSLNKKVHFQFPYLAINIGVSSICSSLCDLKKIFNEALKCISLLSKMNQKNKIYYYNSLGLYRLFMEIDKNNNLLNNYYDDILGPLIKYDSENNTYLIDTLRTYLEQNCSIIQTSKIMYIHRNTLKYRLQRIQEITSRSLDDWYARLEFQNAFLIKNLL